MNRRQWNIGFYYSTDDIYLIGPMIARSLYYTSEVLLALVGRKCLVMPPRVVEVPGPRLRYLAQNCSVFSILGLANTRALGGGRGLRK